VSSRFFSTGSVSCAGHNKWSKIKDKKGASDLQKSVIYSKASQDILYAARTGGSADPTLNLQLGTALRRAKELGVPRENIEKALSRVRRCIQDEIRDIHIHRPGPFARQ